MFCCKQVDKAGRARRDDRTDLEKQDDEAKTEDYGQISEQSGNRVLAQYLNKAPSSCAIDAELVLEGRDDQQMKAMGRRVAKSSLLRGNPIDAEGNWLNEESENEVSEDSISEASEPTSEQAGKHRIWIAIEQEDSGSGGQSRHRSGETPMLSQPAHEMQLIVVQKQAAPGPTDHRLRFGGQAPDAAIGGSRQSEAESSGIGDLGVASDMKRGITPGRKDSGEEMGAERTLIGQVRAARRRVLERLQLCGSNGQSQDAGAEDSGVCGQGTAAGARQAGENEGANVEGKEGERAHETGREMTLLEQCKMRRADVLRRQRGLVQVRWEGGQGGGRAGDASVGSPLREGWKECAAEDGTRQGARRQNESLSEETGSDLLRVGVWL